MRNLIAIAVLIVVVGFLPTCISDGKSNTNESSQKKPNIIFILTDDQR